jgi:hypothetical protein
VSGVTSFAGHRLYSFVVPTGLKRNRAAIAIQRGGH